MQSHYRHHIQSLLAGLSNLQGLYIPNPEEFQQRYPVFLKCKHENYVFVMLKYMLIESDIYTFSLLLPYKNHVTDVYVGSPRTSHY